MMTKKMNFIKKFIMKLKNIINYMEINNLNKIIINKEMKKI